MTDTPFTAWELVGLLVRHDVEEQFDKSISEDLYRVVWWELLYPIGTQVGGHNPELVGEYVD